MAVKPNFTRKKKRQRSGMAFWDSEYRNPEHLALSTEPGEDFLKFTRWLGRGAFAHVLSPGHTALDFGCGNGRHLLYLASTFGLQGAGFDSSATAIRSATQAAAGLPLSFTTRSIAGTYPTLTNDSTHLCFDLMASHYLNSTERLVLRDEIFRLLVPGGFFLMKTFLRDDDLHSERLIKEHPGPEPSSYIHPVIGVPEYVYTEAVLTAFLQEKFIIHKVYRSHQHRFHGRARKRRTITIYAQKDPFA
jgi:SAM-dependent methyltransferase